MQNFVLYPCPYNLNYTILTLFLSLIFQWICVSYERLKYSFLFAFLSTIILFFVITFNSLSLDSQLFVLVLYLSIYAKYVVSIFSIPLLHFLYTPLHFLLSCFALSVIVSFFIFAFFLSHPYFHFTFQVVKFSFLFSWINVSFV